MTKRIFRSTCFVAIAVLIACIVRGEKTIIPGGDDCIKAGDQVIVVTKHILFNDLTDVLTENLQ